MYITKEMIESFLQDVKKLADSCNASYDRIQVCPWADSTGVRISISSGNGYTQEQSYRLAKNFECSWDRESKYILDKHSDFLKEDKNLRQVGVAGEGEYPEDYGMWVTFYFCFGSKVSKSADGYALKFYRLKKELFAFLKKVLKDNSYLIEDKGDVCDIGGYFQYEYATGKVKITNRVNLYSDEKKYLKSLIQKLLLCLSGIGAPMHSVIINAYSSYTDYLYFYSIGEECILWTDFWRDNGYSDPIEKGVNYFNKK